MNRAVLVLAVLIAGCAPRKPEGERLARTYCSVCHAFPEPQLLAKNAWQNGVLPQMAPHLGVSSHSLYAESQRNPNMTVLTKAVSDAQWEKIVAYYLAQAPDSLPDQSLPAEPQIDPAFFHIDAFASHLVSSSIITLLEADSARERIFVGEAGSNRLRVFDLSRRVRAMLTLGSPPTDVIPEDTRVLVLESGILDPNDEAKGRLVQYDRVGDSLRFAKVLIDSLYRPVFVAPVDLGKTGRTDYLICEYGDNRGRLALYRDNGSTYERQVLDATPGAIRFEIRDLTGDGAPDIIALFAQADERIVLFANDGAGHFTAPPRIVLRFPPVYGSMYFAMDDFNGDGKLDIVYVNGDNFDYSRVLKPYHGVRIFENDGRNTFHERYFFPVYGAARAAVADFDRDGDLDVMTTSNFADAPRHAERGIMYLENAGAYVFRPFAFSVAAGNQWNLMATADLNKDGRPDLIVGAMYLENIARRQRYSGRGALDLGKEPLLFFENRTGTK